MADWAEIASALYEYAGWGRQQFKLDWQSVEQGQNESALEGSPVASLVLDYLRAKGSFEGTSGELLEALENHYHTAAHVRGFPAAGNALSRKLNEVTDALRAHGVSVERGSSGKGKGARKVIKLSTTDAEGLSVLDGSVDSLPMNSGIPTDQESPIGTPDSWASEGVVCRSVDISSSLEVEEERGATGKERPPEGRENIDRPTDIDRPAYLSHSETHDIDRPSADLGPSIDRPATFDLETCADSLICHITRNIQYERVFFNDWNVGAFSWGFQYDDETIGRALELLASRGELERGRLPDWICPHQKYHVPYTRIRVLRGIGQKVAT